MHKQRKVANSIPTPVHFKHDMLIMQQEGLVSVRHSPLMRTELSDFATTISNNRPQMYNGLQNEALESM